MSFVHKVKKLFHLCTDEVVSSSSI